MAVLEIAFATWIPGFYMAGAYKAMQAHKEKLAYEEARSQRQASMAKTGSGT